VVGGTGVSHPVRDRGEWGQRHRGEGVDERLRVPPICPRPPHGLGRRPRKGKEPLLRLRRCRGRCRRWSSKEDLLRGGGARHPQTAQATCGWCQSTGCRQMATGNHLSCLGRPPCHCVHSCDHDRGHNGASRLPKSSRRRGTEVR
jgi:hypothetical protein